MFYTVPTERDNAIMYNAFCFDVLNSQPLYLFSIAHCPKTKG